MAHYFCRHVRRFLHWRHLSRHHVRIPSTRTKRIICLVIMLEFLRRVQREYDYLLRRGPTRMSSSTSSEEHVSEPVQANDSKVYSKGGDSRLSSDSNNDNGTSQTIPPSTPLLSTYPFAFPVALVARNQQPARRAPSMTQQLVRSGIYTCQFAVGYFVMLLAMYYNGYILICIFVGAFLGSFIWSWDLGSALGATR